MPEPASAHEPYYGVASPPATRDLKRIKAAAKSCEACHLWLCGTQTVFGEGPVTARVMMIGEQPGDREDLAGKPFVGPAGKTLDKALSDAGIERADVYLTNVVKHFKWERGTSAKRIHGKPNRKEVQACKPWLDAEIELVKPECAVLLGATAAQAVLGAAFRLTKHRGQFVPSKLAPLVTATIHPAAILRAPDEESRRAAYESLVQDLIRVRQALAARHHARML